MRAFLLRLATSHGVAVATLTVVWGVITLRVWLLGETPYGEGFWLGDAPLRAWLRDQLAQGTLPLWNAGHQGGLPVLPEAAYGITYPPSWFFLLPEDPGWGTALLGVVHMLWGGLGAYVLGLRITGRLGATVTAIVFGSSGIMVTGIDHLPTLMGVAWVPWWFVTLAEVLRRGEDRRLPGAWWLGWIGVGVMQVGTQELLLVYVEIIAGALMLGTRAVQRPRSRVGHGLQHFAGGLVGIGLVCAPILIAKLEAWGQGLPLAPSHGAFSSLHPARLWEWVMPAPWGGNLAGQAWTTGVARSADGSFFWASIYFGSAALVLAAFGTPSLVKAHRGLGVAVLLALIAAFGDATPLSTVLGELLPLWRDLANPEVFIVFVVLGAALAAGRGTQVMIESDRNLAALALSVPAGIAAAGWLWPEAVGPQMGQITARPVLAGAVLHTWAVCLCGALAWWILRFRGRPFLLAGIVAMDLIGFAPRVLDTWEPPAVVAPPIPPAGPVFFEPGALRAAVDSIVPADPRIQRRFHDQLGTPNLSLTRGFVGEGGPWRTTLRRKAMLEDALGPHVARRRWGVRHLVSIPEDASEHFRAGHGLPRGLGVLSAGGERSPVRCHSSWRVAHSAREAKELLEAAVGVVAETLGEEPPDPDTVANPPPNCDLDGEGWIVVGETDAELVLIQVDHPYYPGWRVVTDGGQEGAVVPVDLAMAGFVVPAGIGRVRADFLPHWLNWAMLVSMVTGLALAGGGVFLELQRRRGPPPASPKETVPHDDIG